MKLRILLLGCLLLLASCVEVPEETMEEPQAISEPIEPIEPNIVEEVMTSSLNVEVFGEDRVKVTNSICNEIEPGKTASLEQASEISDTCIEACPQAGFERTTGSNYCDTNQDLVCYCVVPEELNDLGARVS